MHGTVGGRRGKRMEETEIKYDKICGRSTREKIPKFQQLVEEKKKEYLKCISKSPTINTKFSKIAQSSKRNYRGIGHLDTI